MKDFLPVLKKLNDEMYHKYLEHEHEYQKLKSKYLNEEDDYPSGMAYVDGMREAYYASWSMLNSVTNELWTEK